MFTYTFSKGSSWLDRSRCIWSDTSLYLHGPGISYYLQNLYRENINSNIYYSTTFIKMLSTGFILIQILESHQKYDENIDLLSGVFLAADMFQMIDLEAAVLQRLSKCCTPNNCLSLYLLVQNLESLATFASLEVTNAKEEVCMWKIVY